MFTEEAALDAICKSNGVTADQLEPMHTEELWQWQLIDPKLFRIKKEEDATPHDEQVARQSAMEHFKTFEGNLKGDHTDTHFVFSKVRE